MDLRYRTRGLRDLARPFRHVKGMMLVIISFGDATHMTREKILSVSHYSIIADVIQNSTHFNVSPAGIFSPAEVSLRGEYLAWNTRGRTAMTCFNTAASSASGSPYAVGFARRWAHTED